MDKAKGAQPCALCFEPNAVTFCVADSCALCEACDHQMHSDTFFAGHLRIPIDEVSTRTR